MTIFNIEAINLPIVVDDSTILAIIFLVQIFSTRLFTGSK